MAEQKEFFEKDILPQESAPQQRLSQELIKSIEDSADKASEKGVELANELEKLQETIESGKASPEVSKKAEKIEFSIEERKEMICEKLIKAAVASNFDEPEIRHVMHIADVYLKKNHPDIADAIHDRLIEARSEKFSGMY